MTQDEQNAEDLERMTRKRLEAMEKLEEFKEWFGIDKTNSGNQILIIGLYRDILRGTEEEVDRLIASLQERNDQAMMRKLSEGV